MGDADAAAGPGAFGAFLTSDAFLLAVLALTLLEAVALVVWHRRTGRGPAPAHVLPFLGAGAAFLLALLAWRRPGGAAPFAAAMTAAFAFHLWHLRSLARLARRPGG